MTELTFVDARATIVHWLKAYLVGPHLGEVDEFVYAGERRAFSNGRVRDEIQQTPYDFYHTGFLTPPKTTIDPEEDDQESQDDSQDTGGGENIMTLANAAQQSAMGLTFQCGDPSAGFQVVADWGEYALVVREEEKEDLQQSSDGAVSKTPLVWRRNPHRLAAIISADELPEGESIRLAEEKGIVLSARRRTRQGLFFITVSLINERQRPKGGVVGVDGRIFQAGIEVEPNDYRKFFVSSANTARRDEDDFWNQELVFRKARQYAVGHGCSVMWDTVGAADTVRSIRTEWIPECEVRKASASVMDDTLALDLEWLADGGEEEQLFVELEIVAERYAQWISDKREEVEAIVAEFATESQKQIREAADKALIECQEQHSRITEGILYLKENPTALEAFRLANRAMAQAMRKRRSDRDPRWFPFQLAFLLLSLPSSSNPNHTDRDTLDLIWFPTGGGKTEAYLFLTAYVIFYRGLSSTEVAAASGTAVLTRYTLRLLTVQQFERSALTVLACEHVRREHPVLKSLNSYSIGLLVGQSATPNRYEQAVELARQEGSSNQTLLPLENCPWCGSRLTSGELRFDDQHRTLITGCSSSDCDFHDDLRISVIDEQILNDPPTFVIATIDKLAQMAWEPGIGRLFGYGDPLRNPPDLIIQDELHLISDSLGTIAALYETAVDWLCSRNGRGPKIIGSTATIRRAAEQTHRLFKRQAKQFPPSGVEAGDSFFYKEDLENPGRLYVGVHAQGRSPKHTLPRILGTVVQAADGLSPPEVRDSFYTVVAYFNSLRELGGSLVIAEDDVPRYLDSLPLPDDMDRRNLVHKVELTSVVESRRIPEILAQMAVKSHDPPDDVEPLDLVLCTNMISVGVDVDRLGLMVITGQPKTTAEYIQASSRVGRPAGSAGLVVTQYNWTRPRDRSHYERFLGYHQAFYRYVEAVSVTPFSGRARDRALRALFASLIRIGIPEFGPNESAGSISASSPLYARVLDLLEVVVERVREIDPEEAESTAEELHGILEDWLDLADSARETERTLFWIPWRLDARTRRQGLFMLEADNLGHGPEGLWPAMLSMRDVDPPAPVRLIRMAN